MTYNPRAISAGQLTAKGDLFVATGPSSVARLPAGSDSTVLAADASQAVGVRWVPPQDGAMTALDPLLLMGA